MDAKDKEKAAFSLGTGLYEFNAMPFGLTNAPATFQRLMDVILEGLPHTVCLVYLDDVIVHGKTFDELLNHLEIVFRRLQDAGLRLSPKKCYLGQREVRFLGHIVSGAGIAVDPKKVSAVQVWAPPLNKIQIQSFLGLCAYYRRFIKDFSAIARPLIALTEKRSDFQWTAACKEAFIQLKQKLVSTPILVQPTEEDEFILDK